MTRPALSLLLLLLSIAVGSAATTDGHAPSFAEIAPIIYSHCAGCHHAGGAAPFALASYDDVRKRARQIADVTGRRYMPPWLPEPGYGDFAGTHRLSDAEIHLIAEWVRAGAPAGDLAQAPAPPRFPGGWQLGKPDLILTGERAFTVPAAGPDVFWNFVFAPAIPATRYVRAIEIRPAGDGSGAIIHHANLLIDRNGSVRRRESAPGVGFAGMDLVIDRNPFDPDSHFLFWKPGAPPYSEPDGLAWRLEPGNLLVLNTHLQPSGKAEQVRPSIALYFTEQAPTRFPILVELEHDSALDIPPGDRDFVVADDFKLPVDSDVLAIYPHAHYLGKLLEGYATLPDGTRRWLIRIPDWDLTWQSVYRYRAPVFLPAGSVISMRFHYDNSSGNVRNPNHPPKRVRAGNEASDEMGHLWLQILPRGRGDRRRPIEEALTLHRIEQDPNDFSAYLNLGAIRLARLNAQGAVAALETAVRLDPKRPEAHDMLGSALRNTGRFAEAQEQFRLALAADPTYTNARYNLAVALAKAGQLTEAVANFRDVAQAFPESPRMQTQFGQLLTAAGMYPEALVQFDRALALDPADAEAQKGRQLVVSRAGERKQ